MLEDKPKHIGIEQLQGFVDNIVNGIIDGVEAKEPVEGNGNGSTEIKERVDAILESSSEKNVDISGTVRRYGKMCQLSINVMFIEQNLYAVSDHVILDSLPYFTPTANMELQTRVTQLGLGTDHETSAYIDTNGSIRVNAVSNVGGMHISGTWITNDSFPETIYPL